MEYLGSNCVPRISGAGPFHVTGSYESTYKPYLVYLYPALCNEHSEVVSQTFANSLPIEMNPNRGNDEVSILTMNSRLGLILYSLQINPKKTGNIVSLIPMGSRATAL